MAAPGSARPDSGDILIVIHDFQARSSDELTLAKGDRVELIERDDEFGDGWFLGKHLVNGNSGLFPEVYTRPAPKNVPLPNTSGASTSSIKPPTPLAEAANEPKAPSGLTEEGFENNTTPAVQSSLSQQPTSTTPITLPLGSLKSNSITTAVPSPSLDLDLSPGLGLNLSSSPSPSPNLGLNSNKPTTTTTAAATSFGSFARPNTSQESHVLSETLNVINEHITDLNSPQGNGALRNNHDSSSEYSSHIDHRLSYIQGEETDEEEEGARHSRSEVEAWTTDAVAEYLFTIGVEKHHCEVFRDQDITGEVLLGMDQTSLFIKAFELGSVGRRLKTWQKIKALQDEVNGQTTRRNTGTYGSDAGSERMRSRTNTITSIGQKHANLDGRPHSKRASLVQTPRMDASQPPLTPVSPTSGLLDSPGRSFHEKRPSAASIRELHHSRRHSSTDFRISGSGLNPAATPKLTSSGTFPSQDGTHKKQPSFDRNWTMGIAASFQRPLSSAGFQDIVAQSEQELQDSAVDLDRGYFSGTDTDPKRRNVIRKRDSLVAGGPANKSSYTEEQRVRSATALSRHSRFGGSVDSVAEANRGVSPAVQKYYGLNSASQRRTASTATTTTTASDSIRPVPPAKDPAPPTVTRLDSSSPRSSPKSVNAIKRLSQVQHPDFNVGAMIKNGLSLRATSDAITGGERSKVLSPADLPFRDSPISPTRTGSSTPSAGLSFEIDSPDTAKSPSTATTAASRGSRKKTKQETSAYTRGLQKITPREAMQDADYSGWMKKKSSNLMTTWKPRLFVLKGRRLAYYYSENDEQEKGLIDISFHRVLPADNERLTGLHATLTGALTSPAVPAGSHVPTLAATEAERDPTQESDSIFIFKLMPPRAGLSRAVNFTKPMVHYFAVPNVKQGRLWMAALMKATIDRDDTKSITTTYQQKTISLAKARQMRHRPPALMNLDEQGEEILGADEGVENGEDGGEKRILDVGALRAATAGSTVTAGADEKDPNSLGIVYDEVDSGVSGLEKLGLHKVESSRTRFAPTSVDLKDVTLPQSA